MLHQTGDESYWWTATMTTFIITITTNTIILVTKEIEIRTTDGLYFPHLDACTASLGNTISIHDNSLRRDASAFPKFDQ
jgi:hypothetical protein